MEAAVWLMLPRSRRRGMLAGAQHADAIHCLRVFPSQQVCLPFPSRFRMLIGMDKIELYDVAVDGGAERRVQVA
jgi:hypothetical protein